MNKNLGFKTQKYICRSPQETFTVGEKVGNSLHGGEVVLLTGGLGAGKTLLTKGILSALDFDIDEVTSPSFTLVNRYDAKLTVYHLDLWRIEKNAASAVGLEEILEDEKAVVVIEWSERLENFMFSRQVIRVSMEGDGDDKRNIIIQ